MSKQTQSDRELEIMLAYDGEPGADSDILGEPGSGDLARGLQETSELVRGHLELATDDADERLAGLWERVERRLSSNGVARAEAEVATSAADTATPRPPRRSLMQRLTEWFEGHRGHFVTGAISAAAVALIMLQFGGEAVKTEVRTVTVPSEPVGQLPVSSPPPTGSPPEVESLEVYQGSGTILTLPDSDGEGSTSVIWLSPDDASETMEGPI